MPSAIVSSWTFENLLFPTTPTPDETTPIGAAELNGLISTKDVSTFLTKDLYLFEGDPSVCCVLGFHTVDVEQGNAANNNKTKLYAVNYSSWIGTHAFGDLSDITALSHEIAETYNDPLVGIDGVLDITPWWLAPNGLCQDDLETGDVIEGLPNGLFPITMNGMTYHPQNEALMQWFEQQTRSNALGGAFSYPNTGVLTKANTPQQPNCGK